MPKGSNSANWLYFIECGEGGPVKIGIASCVFSRLANLQSSNPHKLRCLVAVERRLAKFMEADFHRQFADARIHGEWFNRTAEIEETIERFRSGDRHYLRFLGCTGRALVDDRWQQFLGRARKIAA